MEKNNILGKRMLIAMSWYDLLTIKNSDEDEDEDRDEDEDNDEEDEEEVLFGSSSLPRKRKIVKIF